MKGDGAQECLAHKKTPPPYDPTVALCLETYGGLEEIGVFYERGTPEDQAISDKFTETQVGTPCGLVFFCIFVHGPSGGEI